MVINCQEWWSYWVDWWVTQILLLKYTRNIWWYHVIYSTCLNVTLYLSSRWQLVLDCLFFKKQNKNFLLKVHFLQSVTNQSSGIVKFKRDMKPRISLQEIKYSFTTIFILKILGNSQTLFLWFFNNFITTNRDQIVDEEILINDISLLIDVGSLKSHSLIIFSILFSNIVNIIN